MMNQLIKMASIRNMAGNTPLMEALNLYKDKKNTYIPSLTEVFKYWNSLLYGILGTYMAFLCGAVHKLIYLYKYILYTITNTTQLCSDHLVVNQCVYYQCFLTLIIFFQNLAQFQIRVKSEWKDMYVILAFLLDDLKSELQYEWTEKHHLITKRCK